MNLSATTRPCDDRLRFCDSFVRQHNGAGNKHSRPCDDRLRFCDSYGTAPTQIALISSLDLVMTACGFVTENQKNREFDRLIIYSRPCDDRLRFCDSIPDKLFYRLILSMPRPCDDRLRFCDV